MFLRLLTAIVCLMTLNACKPNNRPPVDPATLQTPATEAVLRYIIEHCPKREEAKLAVIMIGDFSSPATPEFVKRFADVQGLEFIEHERIVAGIVNGKSRRYEKDSNQPVLEVQIGSITEAKEGRQEAVAAWAFMDDALRKRLEVKAKAGGGFEISELETIPVPNINDDRSSAGKK